MTETGGKGQAQKPNTWLAHGAKPVTTEGEVNIGGHGTIALPDEETQRAGFYLKPEEQVLLLIQYPLTYKPAKSIGPVAVPLTPAPPELPPEFELGSQELLNEEEAQQ
jgi:hypothetical protein